MQKLMIPALMAVLVLAGCGRKEEPEKVASLQTQVTTLQTELERQTARNDTLMDQLREAEDRVGDLDAERIDLEKKLRELESADTPAPTADETAPLKKRIGELEAEIAALKEKAAEVKEPDATEPEPAEAPEVDTAAVTRKMEELWPLVKAGDRKALGEMQGQLDGANKEIRDTYITKVRDWVKEEPNNKHARVTLASALATRFQDLTNPMDMGALAGEIKDETQKALEIDPEYYEAQHFLAILQVNYPSFTPEFKSANVALDKALELQSKLTWEDRFGDIYAAYGMWYRVKKEYDNAAAKVQAGLDLVPRHQGLLDEQQRIEDARAEEE